MSQDGGPRLPASSPNMVQDGLGDGPGGSKTPSRSPNRPPRRPQWPRAPGTTAHHAFGANHVIGV
eukprot:4861800-Pyramimonas_sp.AAC.1